MNRCTVCGATSREGAKFCTSCGARLGDDVVQAPAPASFATDKDADPEGAATSSETSVQPAITASNVPSDVRPEHSNASTAEDSSASDNRDTSQATADDRYVSSWPDSDSADAPEERPGTEDEPERAVDSATDDDEGGYSASDEDMGWPDDSESGDDDGAVATAPAPTSFATDADQNSDLRETTGASSDADHHGASEWEGWAPMAPVPASASSAYNEHVEHVNQLLDELRHRIDRITSPASLESRDLNPDDLADQLERWSRAVPDCDDLLEAVKDVRRSPRDIDAMIRMADRAADLEPLVRHYQSITSTSEQWAVDLRRTREETSNM